MIETEMKKFETLEPGIRAFLMEGESLRPANAVDFTMGVQYGRDVCEGNGNKFAEPLRETDYSGLPSAFVVAAALDPLHDDCFDYAARLATVFIRSRNMNKSARESFDAIIKTCASLAHQGRLPD